jgi:hypothetical protein
MSIDSQKVINEHKRGDNDTGSPEVQVALLTARIEMLTEHFTHVAKVTKTFQYGNHQVTLETGEIARQAGGAVIVSHATAPWCWSRRRRQVAREGQDFFPLTVDYQEKFYAGGRIPGGFFKREGRQTEKETLTSRLIDRPIRPLFPEGFRNEVQVIATVMSLNPEVDGDIRPDRRLRRARRCPALPFKRPDRRRQGRLRQRPVHPQPDRRPS